MLKIAPLSSSFMLASMLGFMVIVVYTSHGKLSETWGFTFGLVFAIMFIASMVSMTHAPVEGQLDQLYLHSKGGKKHKKL